MSAEQLASWQQLKSRFDVDLGETILQECALVCTNDTECIEWRIIESEKFGNSKVEFRRKSDGKLHMIGAAAVVYEDGTKLFYQNGFLHNTKGAAKTINFCNQLYCEYYLYGMLTGTSGPCIGVNPKQLPSIPHLPNEPVADRNDYFWQ